MSDAPLPIGIAVIEHRGRYLVGFRPQGVPLAGLAEFPGGKCQPGESAAHAACRECLEETGLEIVAVDLLMHRTFAYAHGTFNLQFWLCRPHPRLTEVKDYPPYRWVPRAELTSLEFPEANRPLIDFLSQPGE